MPELPQAKIVESIDETWSLALTPAGCRTCGQVHLVGKNLIGQPCPNCTRGTLEAQPARMRPEPPEQMLPFARSAADVRNILTAFVKSVWIAPDDLNAEAMLKRAVPVFWPTWLVDGDVAGTWEAECGYDYQVESTRQSYASGQWREQKQIETRARWEARQGQVRRHYDNVSAPACRDQGRLNGWMGGYPAGGGQTYDPQKIGKAALRVPDLPPEDAWSQAKSGLDACAAQDCQQAAGAQHMRNFAIRAEYLHLNWTQRLLPMLVTWYADDSGQRHPVYINGQTGRVGGVRMASQKKGWKWAGILGAVAAGILLLAGLLALLGIAVPPLLPVAGVVAFLALPFGIAAIVPAVWPWQWNQKQKAESFNPRAGSS